MGSPDRHHEQGEQRQAAAAQRDAEAAAPAPPTLVSQVLALQQSAGNAAVSRLVAQSRMVARDDENAPPAPDQAPAPAPSTPAPSGSGTAAPPANTNDALLAMTGTAWDTGVTQRERDAAAGIAAAKDKADFVQAADHLKNAQAAVDSIGKQFATIAPERTTQADVHYNAVAIDRVSVLPFIKAPTPAEVSNAITTHTVPSSEATKAKLTAPLPQKPATP